jgi:hypothetical protein
MLFLKAYSQRFWMLALFVQLTSQSEVFGEIVPGGDTAVVHHATLTHHAEVGLNALGAGLEYRYQWFPFLSTDAVVSVLRPGSALGLTVSPVWLLFVQGIVGTGEYAEASATDGPPAFKPSYMYGWIAGTHMPIAPKKTRLYFIFAFGEIKYVQSHYQYNGGGFIIGSPPAPLYRTERRVEEVFSIGLGISF